jgi:hypothetical protein
LRKYFAFLEALFQETLVKLEKYEKAGSEVIGLEWYKWLKDGQTSEKFGRNRVGFYIQVISSAKKVCNPSLSLAGALM